MYTIDLSKAAYLSTSCLIYHPEWNLYFCLRFWYNNYGQPRRKLQNYKGYFTIIQILFIAVKSIYRLAIKNSIYKK
jgi:hypothetical protein